MNIGVIGLGMMGCAMARNLLRAGHRLTVYNRTRSRAEELQSAGALIAETPAEACRGAAVITCLADDDAAEAIVFGERRRCGRARRGRRSHFDEHTRHGLRGASRPRPPRSRTAVPGRPCLRPSGHGGGATIDRRSGRSGGDRAMPAGF